MGGFTASHRASREPTMPRRSPPSAIAAAAAMATALLLVAFVGGASAKLAVPPLDASASLSRLQPRSADRRRPERDEGKGWGRSQGASASAAAAAAAPKSVGSYHTSQRIQVGGPDAAVSGPPSKLPSTASVAARSGTAPGPPAAGLSPTALVLMALLAVQFGLQPLLVKKFTPAAVNRSTVVFVQEIVKLAVSVWAYLGSTLPKQRGEDWGGGRPAAVLRNLSVAGLPAALYCVQNLAALLAYQNLDPVAFNVLNQTKTLSAALCCYLVLGARQSGRQMLALGMLLAAALVLEKILPLSALIPGGVLRRAATDGSAAPLGSPLAALAALRESLASGGMARRVTHGVLPILLASFLSGLAGALVQRAVQGRGRQVAAGGGTPPRPKNFYLFSTELGIASIFLLLGSFAFSADGRRIFSSGFFHGWTPLMMIPILTQSAGGICVGLVTKHCGSVRKGFALIFGMLLSGLVQAMGGGGGTVGAAQLVGLVLASSSLYLHTKYPCRPRPAKAVAAAP